MQNSLNNKYWAELFLAISISIHYHNTCQASWKCIFYYFSFLSDTKMVPKEEIHHCQWQLWAGAGCGLGFFFCLLAWFFTSWQNFVVGPSSADSANSVQGSFSLVQKAKGMAGKHQSKAKCTRMLMPLKKYLLSAWIPIKKIKQLRMIQLFFLFKGKSYLKIFLARARSFELT